MLLVFKIYYMHVLSSKITSSFQLFAALCNYLIFFELIVSVCSVFFRLIFQIGRISSLKP